MFVGLAVELDVAVGFGVGACVSFVSIESIVLPSMDGSLTRCRDELDSSSLMMKFGVELGALFWFRLTVLESPK